MKDFASYLSQYLKEKGITYRSASKICGLDRTLLGRYCSGDRLPKKASVVESLADSLQMSDREKGGLLESYRRTKVCREQQVAYPTVEAILEGRHGLAASMPSGAAPVSPSGIPKAWRGIGMGAGIPEEHARSLHSADEILWMARYILDGALWVKILASPWYPKLREALQGMAAGLPKTCCIEQMIGLGQHEWKHGEKKLQNLGKLLPLLLQEREYQVYYHYQLESDTKTTGKELDYAITDKGMVLFSPSLEIGFFTNQKEPCSYYGKLYEDRKSMCRFFAKGGAGQYREWDRQRQERFAGNPDTGICFSKTKEEAGIWAVRKEQECAACIQEIGLAQLLERFIWDIS